MTLLTQRLRPRFRRTRPTGAGKGNRARDLVAGGCRPAPDRSAFTVNSIQ